MKTIASIRTIAMHVLAFIAIISALIISSGCASSDAKNQESLLSAAGFRIRTPETAKQKEVYEALPSYKVQRAVADGKTFYVYKDEKQGIAYVGGEPEYQRYQQLAVQKDIASQYYRAAQMNNQAAMGWYGAWGPSVIW